MAFLYLDNLGSPTKWDVSRYSIYRDRVLAGISPDLQSMLQDSRYRLDTDDSFWHASLISLHVDGSELKCAFASASGSRIYEFSYAGVKKIRSDFTDVRARPSLIVQELILLKGGLYRHAMTDLIGRFCVVHAQDMRFLELHRQ